MLLYWISLTKLWNRPLLLIMLIAIAVGLLLASYFLFHPSIKNKKAARFYAGLLVVLSLGVAHYYLTRNSNLGEDYARYFTPIWYVLSIGPFFFYFIKHSLYPNYQLKWSDSKHFILPIWQFIFYWYMFLQTADYKSYIWNNFTIPFYGTLEMLVFIITFYLYISMAYRYTRYQLKISTLKQQTTGLVKITQLKHITKVILYLLSVYTLFIVTDIIGHHFFNANVQNATSFAFLRDLSFVAMLYYLIYKSKKVYLLLKNN